jgi:hypothetical protein
MRQRDGPTARLSRLLINPPTGIAGCCAHAAIGHAAAAPPSSVMNSRRRMWSMECLPSAGYRTAACKLPTFEGDRSSLAQPEVAPEAMSSPWGTHVNRPADAHGVKRQSAPAAFVLFGKSIIGGAAAMDTHRWHEHPGCHGAGDEAQV